MKLVRLGAVACAIALSVSAAAPAPVPPPAQNTPELELARLAGQWQAVEWQVAGSNLSVDGDQNKRTVAFAGDSTFAWDLGSSGKIARIDPTQKLKEIDYAYTSGGFKDKLQKAIYKLEGDTLTECFAEPGAARPTEFKSTKENGWGLIAYKRIKKND